MSIEEQQAATARRASPVPKAQLDVFAVALLTVMCMCLAVGQVAIKVANAGISPVLQAGLRSLAAAMFLGLFAKLRGVQLFACDGILWPALATSLFFTAEFAFLYPGLERTTAAHAVILLYTSPFVVAAGAHYLIPGDQLTAAKIAGLCLALVGVATVVLGRDAVGLDGRGPTLEGDLLCLAAAFAWGFLTLTIRATRLATVAPERVTFLQLVISGVLLTALSVFAGEPGFSYKTTSCSNPSRV